MLKEQAHCLWAFLCILMPHQTSKSVEFTFTHSFSTNAESNTFNTPTDMPRTKKTVSKLYGPFSHTTYPFYKKHTLKRLKQLVGGEDQYNLWCQKPGTWNWHITVSLVICRAELCNGKIKHDNTSECFCSAFLSPPYQQVLCKSHIILSKTVKCVGKTR